MPRLLLDDEIAMLIGEEKRLPVGWRERLRPKVAPGSRHNRAELAVPGSAGSRFVVKVRQNQFNNADFSVILIFIDTDAAQTEYILRRYNGSHRARHTNDLEREQRRPEARFGPCPHIHEATERYQLAGKEIDAFASATDAYKTLPEAIERFVSDNWFIAPPGENGGLFDLARRRS